MAPVTSYPGLNAQVIVDGRPLTEYSDVENTRPNTTTVYIQSEEDEQFGIRYFVPESLFQHDSIKAVVSIDGVTMRKYIHDKYIGRLHGVSRYAYASSAHYGNGFFGQRFSFASLDTHDNADTINTTVRNQLASTGNISVAFYRVTNIRIAGAGKEAPTIHEYDKVPEKALKGSAVSLKTILGPPERIAPVRWMEADDVEPGPFAVIHFKYRSADALRSMNFLPPLPDSRPLQRRRIHQLSRTDRPSLLGTCLMKDEKPPSLKRERTADKDEDGDIQMVWAQRAKRRCLPTDKDEVITLD